MTLTQTNRLKLSSAEQQCLKELCRLSKNMFNVGLYNVRQYFFQERKHLRYEGNYHYAKENENYKALATDIAQQTLKIVDRSFRSFFKLVEMKRQGTHHAKVNIPHYLPKDGYFMLAIPVRERDWQKLASKDWVFNIPTSRAFRRQFGTVGIQIPERLRDKQVKEIRILPKYGARYFDAAFVYESPDIAPVEQTDGILAIDLGLDNFATCVSTTHQAFIIDGKGVKSINQWYNKRNAQLQSLKDKQGITGITNRQARLLDKRNHKVSDFLNKAARHVANWCITNRISTVVVGYNPDLKQSVNMGKRNNQSFTQIPIFTFKRKLESLCERYGIKLIEQEESYTSKASALDADVLPVWKPDSSIKHTFSGKRIKRGLYRTAQGWLVNADANGALNILRKHTRKLDDLIGQFRGCLAQPLRISIS